MQTPHRNPNSRVASDPGVRLRTLLEDLLWPRLFEAAPLAVRPERLLFAIITIVLLGLVGSTNLLWNASEPFLPVVYGQVSAEVSVIWSSLWSWDLASVRLGLERLLTDVPHQIWQDHTVSVLVLLPVLTLIWGVGGIAIARSGACEFAMGLSVPWPRTVAFAIERWRSVLAAFLGPWVIIGILSLIVWVFGLVIGLPYIGVVAAVLFFIGLFIAALAVLLMLGYLLGFILLGPAVACEGTDAIDAIQRTYARVFGKPFRLILYMAIAAAIGFVAISAVTLFVDAVTGFVVEVVGVDTGGAADSVGWTGNGVMVMWLNLLALLVSAYALSYFHTASMAVYLILRQVADGQDVADLWLPGMIEGTMTEALDARGEVTRKG